MLQQDPRNGLFTLSPLLGYSMACQASWLLEARAPGPLSSPAERRSTASPSGPELAGRGMFLDCRHSNCLLICETQSLTHPWHLGPGNHFKEARFLWEGSFCLDLERGVVNHTPPFLCPNISAFNKG